VEPRHLTPAAAVARSSAAARLRAGMRFLERPSASTIALALPLCVAVGFGLSRVPHDSTPTLLAFLLFVVCVIPFVFAWARGKFDPFEPVNLVMFFLGFKFIGATLLGVVYGSFYEELLPGGRGIGLVNLALSLAILGAVAFLFGYYHPPRAAERLSMIVPQPNPTWSSPRLRQTIVVFTAVGIVAFFYFMSIAGGLGYFVAHLYQHNEASAGRHYLLGAALLLPVASLLWFAYLSAQQNRHLRRRVFWVHFAAASAMLFALGGRGHLLAFWETMVIIHHYAVRAIRPRHLVIFAAFLVIAFSLIGTYRESTAPGGTAFSARTALTGQGLANQLFFHLSSAPMTTLVVLLDKVPREIPYRDGMTFANTFVQPIPRAFYAGKPPPQNTWYNQNLYGRGRSGKKATVIGLGYVNFGILGVALIMFLYGLVARAVYFYLDRNRFNPVALLIYAVLLKYIWSNGGGGFDELTVKTLQLLIPTLIGVGIVCGWANRKRAPALAPMGRELGTGGPALEWRGLPRT
jgi:oligosaccharide repeat unit polymerase